MIHAVRLPLVSSLVRLLVARIRLLISVGIGVTAVVVVVARIALVVLVIVIVLRYLRRCERGGFCRRVTESGGQLRQANFGGCRRFRRRHR